MTATGAWPPRWRARSWSPPTATWSARRDDRGPAGQDFDGWRCRSARWAWSPSVTLDLVPTFDVRQSSRRDRRRGPGARAPGRDPRPRVQRQPVHRLERAGRRARSGSRAWPSPAGRTARLARVGRHAGRQPPAPGRRMPDPRRHRAARRARAVERAAAALPAGVHARARGRSCSPSTSCRASTRRGARPRCSSWRDLIAPVLLICEIRTVAADELWLSPAYRRATAGAALHLGARRSRGGRPCCRESRTRWRRSAPAPALGQGVHARRPRRSPGSTRGWPTSGALRRRYDPGGKLGNDFTGRYLGAVS